MSFMALSVACVSCLRLPTLASKQWAGVAVQNGLCQGAGMGVLEGAVPLDAWDCLVAWS